MDGGGGGGDTPQPLSYLGPDDDVEDEEVDRRREGRMLALVLTVGAAFVLGVWTVPAATRRLAIPAWSPIQQSPPPAPPAITKVAPSEEVVAAVEAYRDVRGMYPASLDQLGPAALPAGADRARWRYVVSPDRCEYWLHFVGNPPTDEP